MNFKQKLSDYRTRIQQSRFVRQLFEVIARIRLWYHKLTPEKKLFIFGILLCTLAISLSFEWGTTIRHGDSTFPQDPELSFKKAISTWDDMRRMGIDNSRGVADGFPYKGLAYFLSLIGLPVFFIQILMFGGLFILPFITMFYLVKALFPRQQFGLMSFFAGLFYAFNIYVLIKFSVPVFVIQLAYGLLPLFIAFGLQFLDTGKKKFFLYFILTALANSSIGNNIAFYVPIVIIFGVIFIHRLITKKGEQWTYIKRFFTLLVGSIIISLWWFIPQITAIGTQYSSVANSEFVQEYNEIALRSTSFEGHMLNSMRLIGTWTWSHNDLYGNAFFEESQMYDGLLSFWGILLVMLTLGALLIKRAHYMYVVLFSLTFFLGLFLMKGISDPFGNVFMFMFENIPLFWIFRFTYDKFGPITVLSQAILIGYTLYWLTFKLVPRFKAKAHVILILFTGLIVFYMYPIWMGHTFRDGYPVQTQVNFPNAYFEANHYLNDLYIKQQRVVVLPFSLGNGIAKAFQWNYVGMDPFEFLSRHSVIYHLLETDGPSADMVQLMKTLLHEKQWNDFIALAPLFNVDKVVMENNADISLFPDLYFSEEFSHFTQINEGIDLEVSFEDEIDIYNLPHSERYEKIYIPQNIYNFRGNFERLGDLAPFLKKDERNAFILNQYNEDLEVEFSQYANHEVIPIPGVYENNSLADIKVEELRNGSYDIWHRRNDYQLYQVSLRPQGQKVELLFEQPTKTFKVNNKTLTIKGNQQVIPLQIQLNRYDKFYLSINEHFLGEIDVENLRNQGKQLFGQYPLQPNADLFVRLYGEQNSTEADLLGLQDPSFEEGVWSEVRVIGEDKGGEDFQEAHLIPGGTDGEKAIEIMARNRDAAVYQNIFGYDTQAFYRVEFDYHVEEGGEAYINLIEQGVEVYNTINLKRDASEQWQHFEQLVLPNTDATGLSLYIYAKASKDPNHTSQVVYDNFSMARIPLIQELRTTFAQSDEGMKDENNLGQVNVGANELLFFGSVNLMDVTEKVLKNASFEQGPWSRPADSKADLPGVPTMISKTVEENYEGEKALLLSTNKHKANIHHRLDNLDSNVRYIVSMATKKNAGSDASFLIHQKGVNIYAPKDNLREEEGLEGQWNMHRFAFNPSAQAQGATLYLYAGDGKEEFSEVLYDAIKIYQVNNLDSFVAEKSIGETFEKIEVHYDHHSPTRYSGKILKANHDFVMVFGESYHPNWGLTLTNEQTGESVQIPKEDHFIINGYANGWHVPAGQWSFEIQFRSQRTYILSIFLSLFLSLVFFGFYFFGPKKRRQLTHSHGPKRSSKQF